MKRKWLEFQGLLKILGMGEVTGILKKYTVIFQAKATIAIEGEI